MTALLVPDDGAAGAAGAGAGAEAADDDAEELALFSDDDGGFIAELDELDPWDEGLGAGAAGVENALAARCFFSCA